MQSSNGTAKDMLDEQADESEQDQVMNMLDLGGNSDLIRGVYEGGFKTWECSVDLVQFLANLPADDICDKRILEVEECELSRHH